MTPPAASQSAQPIATRIVSGLGETTAPPADLGAERLKLDPSAYDVARRCVHCGLCLPVCPTYTQNTLEADSPRGRIYLMKGLADGKIGPTDAVLKHLDLCLDCRACETACPSGIVYHRLIEDTRLRQAPTRRKTLIDRLVRAVFLHVFPYPTRLKLAMLPARLLQKTGLWRAVRAVLAKLVPAQVEKMLTMLPVGGPVWESPLEARYPARAVGPDAPVREGATGRSAAPAVGSSVPPPEDRARVCPAPEVQARPVAPGPGAAPRRPVVGFFAGCVSSVLEQQINRQAIELLQLAGCEVVAPRGQTCCGAIHHHAADADTAEDLARRNIDVFLGPASAGPAGASRTSGGQPQPPDPEPSRPGPVDFIVTPVGGCGAMLKEYAQLLRHDRAYAPRAEQFVAKVRDISQLLVELGLPAPRHELNLTVTYHDACHLAHGQGVTAAPRTLLGSVRGLKVVPLPESDICCGAAGTYNLTQPAMARQLAERKIRAIQGTGAKVCVLGNIGCAMQLRSEAQRLGVELEVVHPVTLLHRAHFGTDRR